MAIVSYKNLATREIAENIISRKSRQLLPIELHPNARIIMSALDNMTSLKDLRIFPSWRLEKLKGNRRGSYSLRINKQFRICFNWDAESVSLVEIIDYH